MANSKGYFARRSQLFLPISGNRMDSDHSPFEFHESDIYNNNSSRVNSFEYRSNSLHAKKPSSSSQLGEYSRPGAPASMPVNVPDWSKILGDEYRKSTRRKNVMEEEKKDEDDFERSDDDDDDEWLPPHEFLARTRGASFSVHEGVGRTLKGRDLSRVRNAIWAKTGFQD